MIYLRISKTGKGEENGDYARPNGQPKSEHQFGDRRRGRIVDASQLKQFGGARIEAIVAAFESELQKLFVGNQNDHGDEKIETTDYDAHRSFADRLIATTKVE